MQLMTVKQYAEMKGITYEAARRQVVKYRQELGSHITRKNGAQFLDDYAVDFLNSKRRASHVVVIQEKKQDKIDELSADVEELKRQLDAAREKILELTALNNTMIEAKTRYELLLEVQEQTKEELKAARSETADVRQELRETSERNAAALQEVRDQLGEVKTKLALAEQEAGSYYRSFFGFYRKR